MRLTVVAATGGIGRQVLDQALAADHDVTIAVRNPAGLPERLRGRAREVVVDLAADTPDARAALEDAIDGADAVLSGLGPRGLAEAGIASHGTRAVVRAMQATQTRRIVAVGGAASGRIATPSNPNPPKHDPGDGFFMRHFGARLAGLLINKQLVDVALMEHVLRESELEWTAIRAPLLNDRPAKRSYRVAYGQNIPGRFRVTRADVADYMLRVLDQPETVEQAIGIAN